MSVRMSVCPSGLGGNVIFSAPVYKALIFCVHIPLVYEHLIYKYFVRRTVGQATKGKRASLLMDVVILVYDMFFFKRSKDIFRIYLLLKKYSLIRLYEATL